jgi:hypothetical protein
LPPQSPRLPHASPLCRIFPPLRSFPISPTGGKQLSVCLVAMYNDPQFA